MPSTVISFRRYPLALLCVGFVHHQNSLHCTLYLFVAYIVTLVCRPLHSIHPVNVALVMLFSIHITTFFRHSPAFLYISNYSLNSAIVRGLFTKIIAHFLLLNTSSPSDVSYSFVLYWLSWSERYFSKTIFNFLAFDNHRIFDMHNPNRFSFRLFVAHFFRSYFARGVTIFTFTFTTVVITFKAFFRQFSS